MGERAYDAMAVLWYRYRAGMLAALVEHDGAADVVELCKETGLDRHNVSRSLEALADAGLLELGMRPAPDGSGTRRWRLTVEATPLGREVGRHCLAIAELLEGGHDL